MLSQTKKCWLRKFEREIAQAYDEDRQAGISKPRFENQDLEAGAGFEPATFGL